MKKLKTMFSSKSDNTSELQELILGLHAWVHDSAVSGLSGLTLEDEVWRKQTVKNFNVFTAMNLYSVAWHLWHSARIEDITANHYITGTDEIFHSGGFAVKLNVKFCHTGNSMTFADMEAFNGMIDLDELHAYRNTVGKRTREIIRNLDDAKMKEQVPAAVRDKIISLGSVAPEDGFLLDFWGKKRISGIITMPLTRHLLVHLNSVMRLLR
ncbi:MAG: hypothetical protein JW874_10970 [Spirochaetales bacterium]|nr:hypothetical protein [Spirochaetales bacterium]